jgi:protein arginine N-methyltransferase 1
MYSVHDYGAMIADRVRMDAYSHALRLSVAPGSVVLDLGAGAGTFALFACRSGARRVYAVEPSNIIEVGREIAAANRLADRIAFVQQRSEQVRLPERVDVIVSDMRGVLPWLYGSVRAFIDARDRFLAPGGRVIGRRDTLWAAIVEAPVLHRDHFAGWDEPSLSLDQNAGRRIMANSWTKGRVTPDQLLSEARCWATLDYETVTSPDVSADVVWTAARSGSGHGLVVWFDAELMDDVGFSNAPGKPDVIYGTAFFPWPVAVPVEAGDTVYVSIRAELVGEDYYVWSWNSRIEGRGGTRAGFHQTSLLGEAVSPETLRRRAVQYRPAPGEDGQIDRFILSAMNGRASVGTIARRTRVRFPERFTNLEAAIHRVALLSERYACAKS